MEDYHSPVQLYQKNFILNHAYKVHDRAVHVRRRFWMDGRGADLVVAKPTRTYSG